MVIFNVYSMGQIVYIKTDVDQMPAQITRIIVYPNNFYMYGVTHKGAYYTYDEIELSADRDVVFATGGNIAAPPKPQ